MGARFVLLSELSTIWKCRNDCASSIPGEISITVFSLLLRIPTPSVIEISIFTSVCVGVKKIAGVHVYARRANPKFSHPST